MSNARELSEIAAAVTVDGDKNVAVPAGKVTLGSTALGAGNASIMKNRIINGAMVIDQRNAGASVTPTASAYTLDRWRATVTQSSKFSVQQNAGSLTPAVTTGFTNYLGVTSLSAYSVLASDNFNIQQRIEGYNIADLGWGTASAKTVTLSFWVYSSLTGAFGGSIQNINQTRSYPFNYSIPVANTWTQISVTIAGDTTGTWATNNTIGIILTFGLGVGSTYSGTAGSWATADYRSATGATSVVGTDQAKFYITGVSLEVGSSSTGYEYRQYQQELALCQRYALPVSGSFTGYANGTTVVDCSFTYPVPMRTAPTAGASSNVAVASAVTSGGSTSTQSSINMTFPGVGSVTPYGATLRFGNFTGLTSTQAAYVYTNASTPAGFLTAEL